MIRNVVQAGCVAAALVLGFFGAARIDAQGQREGIVVHGHWVIEVRNPDGSVAERRDFENGLLQGAEIMTSLLTRQYSIGRWAVGLLTSGSSVFGNNVGASLVEPVNLIHPGNPAVFRNLTVKRVGGNFQSIVLEGDAKAVGNGSIAEVDTFLAWCEGQASCAPDSIFSGYTRFTGKELNNTAGAPPPIQLVANQTVHVTVTISFISP